MCYSLSLFSDIQTLVKRFGARPAAGLSLGRAYYVSAFAFPEVPVIADQSSGLIQAFRWGLIPSWVKDREKAEAIRIKTLNARLETLPRRASFKRPYRERRCLVLTDGFFEFREVGDRKYPYFIHLRSGEPFALAGLWEAWRNPEDGREEKTFTVVTVPANPLLATIHNTKKRMPFILTPEAEQAWLMRPFGMDEAVKIVEGFDASVLEAYPVSRRITARDVDSSRMELLDWHNYPEVGGD